MNKTKRIFIFFILFQILCPPKSITNENDSSIAFYMNPKDAYVGDEVSVYYEFYAPIDLFSLFGTEKLRFNKPRFPLFDSYNCELLFIEISGSYQKDSTSPYLLHLCFLPFTTGIIDIPAFDLRHFFSSEGLGEGLMGTEDFFGPNEIPIKIPSFEIKTILSLYPDTGIRPMQGIVLLPGTSFLVYLFLCLFLLCIILALYFTYSAKKIQFSVLGFFKSFFRFFFVLMISQKIKKLLKKNIDLRTFSFRLHASLCHYISKRTGNDCSSATNTEILQSLHLFYDGLLGEREEAILFDLQTLFIRLDYFRFSPVLLQEEALKADEGEKKSLANQVIVLMRDWEKQNV